MPNSSLLNISIRRQQALALDAFVAVSDLIVHDCGKAIFLHNGGSVSTDLTVGSAVDALFQDHARSLWTLWLTSGSSAASLV